MNAFLISFSRFISSLHYDLTFRAFSLYVAFALRNSNAIFTTYCIYMPYGHKFPAPRKLK